jgi:hypothetical protein
MKSKKIPLSEQFQNPFEQLQNEAKSIPLTHTDRSHSWLGTGTVIKSGGFELVSSGKKNHIIS